MISAKTSAVLSLLVMLNWPVGAAAESLLVGTWQGQVYENNVGNYVVTVEIAPGGASGRVEFHQYPCGGTLTRISGNDNQAEYAESLTFGQERCIDGLTARIALSDPNTIYFEEIYDGQANVYGTGLRLGQAQGRPCIST